MNLYQLRSYIRINYIINTDASMFTTVAAQGGVV